jgi:SPP1 family predicted phage head-tail adaptor
MALDPGKLRQQVHVQAKTRVRGAGGAYTESWADESGPHWAAVTPLEGGEAMRGMQLEATVSHRVEMRWRANVTAAKRLRYGSRYLTIQRVIDRDEMHTELELLCEEVAG